MTMTSMLRTFVFEQHAEVTLANRLKAAKAIAPKATDAERVRLGFLPLLLPDLVEAVERVIIASERNPAVRAFAGGLLTYVYNPLDFIGDETPLGRLDDAMICALGLRRLLERRAVELDASVSAMIDVVTEALPLLRSDLRAAIEDFVADLEGAVGNEKSPLAKSMKHRSRRHRVRA